MKKNKYIFIFLFIITIAANSQNFAPIGAKWYYRNSGKIQMLQSVKDTLYQGKMCRKLVLDSLLYLEFEYAKDLYIYEEDSAVFFYNPLVAKFQKLYDFKQKIGNEWYFNYDYNVDNDNKIDTIKIKVVSIENTTINGKVLKQYEFFFNFSVYLKGKLCADYFSFLPENDRGNVYFYEKIGVTTGFLVYTFKPSLYDKNDFLHCYQDKFYPTNTGTLLNCYEDAEIGLYKTYRTKECNSLELNPSTLTGINSDNIDKSITISPNPSNGVFTILATTNDNFNITVTNMLGNIIYQTKSSSNATELNLQHMPKGIYFVSVSAKDKVTSYYKVVVQ